MESFFKSVERPAYRMALMACRNRDDALDLVQDAMCSFVDRYAGKPRAEWKPLFYRMLHNRILDLHRRQTVRDRVRGWFGLDRAGGEDDGDGGIEQAPDTRDPGPEHAAKVKHAWSALQDALSGLPVRQRQAFLLRGWEELSVAETATAMGCTEGSVKTHYSRAMQALRDQLGEHWP